MAEQSTMKMALGTPAPNFSLTDTDANTITTSAAAGPRGLLVAFICNHCPYVKHVQHALAQVVAEFQALGVGAVGISSNDVETHPEDGPEMMAKEKADVGYSFPYVYDETQEVARAYGAACTPDFFLFDGDLLLVYRGRMDATRPNSGDKATGDELRAALQALVQGTEVSTDQRPSVGCSIKWKSA